jgi:hypothetical protein
MKNLFNDIPQSEKQRILEMHVEGTKRNYLSETETIISSDGYPVARDSSGAKTPTTPPAATIPPTTAPNPKVTELQNKLIGL